LLGPRRTGGGSSGVQRRRGTAAPARTALAGALGSRSAAIAGLPPTALQGGHGRSSTHWPVATDRDDLMLTNASYYLNFFVITSTSLLVYRKSIRQLFFTIRISNNSKSLGLLLNCEQFSSYNFNQSTKLLTSYKK
jgi:hypothetical protein